MTLSDPQEPVYLFLHLRKAEGTTLKQILRRLFATHELLELGVSTREQTAQALAHLGAGRIAGLRCVAGQMPFGMHRYLPHECKYLTMLREPVARVISYYLHILVNPDHYAFQTIVHNRMSLDAFVFSEVALEIDNGQTRMLSGLQQPLVSPPLGGCTAEHLELAKHNLEKAFAWVGLLEQFDPSLVLLAKALQLDLQEMTYRRENVNPLKLARERIAPRTIERIRELNQLDLARMTLQRSDSLAMRCAMVPDSMKRWRACGK